jgi:alpha-galactosidase
MYKPDEMQAAYKKMHEALTATGRPILFSLCQYGMQEVWKWGPSVGGQMWRTTGDIQGSYPQMMLIGLGQNGLEKYAGPGHWNDPDMLEIGNGRMKADEYRTQMTLWCVLAAPLFAGNDLTKMNQDTLEILTNPEVIAIDQDSAGVQGHRVWQEGPSQIWIKQLSDGSSAVAIFNLQNRPVSLTVPLKVLDLSENAQARNLWSRQDLGTLKQTITAAVPRHGAVLLKIKSK